MQISVTKRSVKGEEEECWKEENEGEHRGKKRGKRRKRRYITNMDTLLGKKGRGKI